MPIAGALIGAAGAIGGGLIAAGGAKSAANTAANSAAQANELQKYMYDTTRADQQPWRDIGGAAIKQLQAFTTPGTDLTSWLQAQPGYQEGLTQGVNTVQGSAAASGLLHSGGTLKALDRFGQDYANTNLTNIYNRLTNLAGMGQTANQSIANAGQNYANQAGNNLVNAGNVAANAQAQTGARWGSTVNALSGIGANYLGGGYQPNSLAGAAGLGAGLNVTPFEPITSGVQPANIQTNYPGLTGYPTVSF